MDEFKIIVKKDGDMWCAHDDKFINLQESNAEFAQKPEIAAFFYIKKWGLEDE